MHKAIDLGLLANEKNDIFFRLKDKSIENIKDILVWADRNGISTEVTMLDIEISCGRVKSDKDFNTVLITINKLASDYFVIILRKNMNLFGILHNKKVIGDVLEVGIRGIDVDSKEYFIIIYLKPKFLKELSKKYALIRIV